MKNIMEVVNGFSQHFPSPINLEKAPAKYLGELLLVLTDVKIPQVTCEQWVVFLNFVRLREKELLSTHTEKHKVP